MSTYTPVPDFALTDGPDTARKRVTVAMAGLGETWTLPSVHVDHLPMVLAAARSGRLRYGPTYSRQMAEAIRDLTNPLAHDHTESIAYFAAKVRAHLADGAT